MDLLSSEECRLIAQRTLQLPEAEENLILIKSELIAGSNELMGYMGEYYKLHLELENAETKSKHYLQYFVKSLPHKNAPQKAECERKGFFRKETTIYRDILPNLQKYANKKLFPQCYYTRDDIMVLEDLSVHYRHLKLTECYTLEHYKLILEHLAALHAASIAWEQKQEINIGEKFKNVLIEFVLNMENEWFCTGLRGIVFLAARHGKYQTEAAQKFIKENLYQLLTETEQQVASSKAIRNVLCHRDTWDRNMLFSFANEDAKFPNSCCLVDFQLTKYCSPALDVLYLLYIVPTASERMKLYEPCLQHYFNALQSEFTRLGITETRITRENFLEQCERNRLTALTLRALTDPQTKMLPSITNKMRAEDPEKFDYYLNSDRSEMYLRVMQLQPGYEQIIMSPIEELVDYLMENQSLCK